AAPEIVVTTNYRASNNCVSVTIADNGTGIPLEVQSRIFDPFFTTKAVGSGTGLGLSVTYQIVRDLHHGTISCHSAPNLGAAFTLELPCQPAQISLMNKSPLNKSQLN
ncbi:MAG: ATP-binding protein, partial [Cyanobacteria bacterium P01_D01_bin.73]